ncbi:hypothetical protein U1Q18_007434 [Sarracenia purpurea var. burkii]
MFGFVRFRDGEAVDRAIKMYGGVWRAIKKLAVKRAWGSYGNPRMGNSRHPSSMETKKKDNNNGWSQHLGHGPNRRGMKPRSSNLKMLVIEAEGIEEEWHKPCAVGIVL